MRCRVCNEPGQYRQGKRQALCSLCNIGTPTKVSRDAFDEVYWAGSSGIPEGIKREFYEDYLLSMHTVDEYVRVTAEG